MGPYAQRLSQGVCGRTAVEHDGVTIADEPGDVFSDRPLFSEVLEPLRLIGDVGGLHATHRERSAVRPLDKTSSAECVEIAADRRNVRPEVLGKRTRFDVAGPLEPGDDLSPPPLTDHRSPPTDRY